MRTKEKLEKMFSFNDISEDKLFTKAEMLTVVNSLISIIERTEDLNEKQYKYIQECNLLKIGGTNHE